jgi:hypothetical protein
VSITALYLGRWGLASSWLTVLPAVQLILLVFRLHYFFQAFNPTRSTFMDTCKLAPVCSHCPCGGGTPELPRRYCTCSLGTSSLAS